jgi:hypothetical protein
MFLLNSRSSLVTSTRSLHKTGHPLFQSYGTNLPSSLTQVIPDTPWATNPGAPVSVLGTDMNFVPASFSQVPGIGPTLPLTAKPFTHSTGSHHDGTPRTQAFRWGDCPTGLIPKRQMHGLRCRTYIHGAGILTGFPFDSYLLGAALGPPNSRLTTIAEKPLPLRRLGFSPNFLATTARILVSGRSTGTHAPASAPPQRSSTPPRKT